MKSKVTYGIGEDYNEFVTVCDLYSDYDFTLTNLKTLETNAYTGDNFKITLLCTVNIKEKNIWNADKILRVFIGKKDDKMFFITNTETPGGYSSWTYCPTYETGLYDNGDLIFFYNHGLTQEYRDKINFDSLQLEMDKACEN
jgi:hypothetical protein